MDELINAIKSILAEDDDQDNGLMAMAHKKFGDQELDARLTEKGLDVAIPTNDDAALVLLAKVHEKFTNNRDLDDPALISFIALCSDAVHNYAEQSMKRASVEKIVKASGEVNHG